jgi:DNA processing protein
VHARVHVQCHMTSDLLLALFFVPRLSRVGLTSRIQAGDPEFEARARPFLAAARRARDLAGSQGIHWATWGDPRFPTPLLSLGDAPSALWYRGHLAALTRPAVAVVGSRAASAVAREMAARLGEALAARGVLVVSGLARSVDSAAHRGAMTAGLTAAILGSGLDVIYQPEHTALAREIAGTGVLLSEYPPGTPPRAYHFPLRNRLLSGRSLCSRRPKAAGRSSRPPARLSKGAT